jgi:hypothetical protein
MKVASVPKGLFVTPDHRLRGEFQRICSPNLNSSSSRARRSALQTRISSILRWTGAASGGRRMPPLPITVFVAACVSLLPTGCSSHQEPNSASGVSLSSPTATAGAHPTPKRFDPKPRTAEEKKYDAEIRPNLDPSAGKKYDNIYWATRSYKGLRIKDDQARVAIDSNMHIPAATLHNLPKWFGNMAGDPQGIPKYQWILVDYRTGSPVKVPDEPEKLVPMPDIVGKYGDAAVATLQATGISTNHITWKSLTGKGVWLKSNWRVIAQNPSPGSKVSNKNAAISLLVAK